jgi:hypothetical protein
MRTGYPYYGTGNSGTDVTATIIDPQTGTAITKVPLRGKVNIAGISPSCDGPAWNIWHRVKVGTVENDYRYVSVFPSLDADAPSGNLHDSTYQDLGGVEVGEGEDISIIIDDPGTANHAGVLWVDTNEPDEAQPVGRIITQLHGGTNDASTTLSTTGWDLDANKLPPGGRYSVFKVQAMPEDKVINAAILQCGSRRLALPNIGTMVYPRKCFEFTGQEYNDSLVTGLLDVQAATKVKYLLWLIETGDLGSNWSPAKVAPKEQPGVVTLADVAGVSGTRRLTSLPSFRR